MGFNVPEKYRDKKYSNKSDGNNGVFRVPRNNANAPLTIVASDGMGWEHVSVTLPGRPPTWDEMCKVKELFWDEDDTVIQYHPGKDDYVDNHPNCLHMWRPIDKELPKPNPILVGFK